MKIFSSNNLPDIDEWLRSLADKLSKNSKKGNANQFSRDDSGGGYNGGDGGDDDNESIRQSIPPVKYLVSLLSALLLVVWLLAGFFTVDAGERAVMLYLGSPRGVKTPGLSWHMPLIEDYRIVNLSEVRRVEIGYRSTAQNKNLRESLMLTRDLNIIDIQFVVQYVLNDPQLFLFENRFTNRRAEDIVKQAAETSMREVVGKNDIDFVLNKGREAVASETKLAMQEILNKYKTGIEINHVAVQNVQPPDQVQGAFEDAIKARQDRERKINEGQAYANDIIPRSHGQAARILENAEAYKAGTIARASGKADRFLQIAKEYNKAPEITRRRLYLETMEEVMARASKVVIDDKVGSGNLLYLPLDKLGAAAVTARKNAEDNNYNENNGEDSSSSSLSGLKKILRQRGLNNSGDTQLREQR